MKSEKKPDIVFVFPHLEALTGTIAGIYVDSFVESLGTAYIRAYLAEHCIVSEQYVQFEPKSVKQIAREIIEIGAPVIGFSCYDFSLYICLLIADAIKSMQPELTIIFGGPTITLASDMIIEQHPEIDVCCRGECEETCLELLLKMKNKDRLDDVAGITFRDRNRIIRTPDRLIKYREKKGHELDFLPSPYLTGIMLKNEAMIERQVEFSLISARGCTHHCTYCTNTALRKNSIHYHSVDRVLAEIKHIAEIIKPSQQITFFDDAFTLNRNRAKEICSRIIAESLNHIRFHCLTRIDRFDEELINLMAQAGFKEIVFGLESASPKVLNQIKKVRSKQAINDDYSPEVQFLEAMKKNIHLANAKGITTSVSIILGLPGETELEAKETLSFVENLPVRHYIHHYLNIIYGTEIFNQCHKYGLEITPHPMQLIYWTDYAYDVFAIKPLMNSLEHREMAQRNILYIDKLLAFFRVGSTLPIDMKENARFKILIETSPDDELKLFVWLAKFIKLNSEFFIIEDDWGFDSRQRVLQSFAGNKIPLFIYQRLKKRITESTTDPPVKTITYSQRSFHGNFLDTAKFSYKKNSDFNCHIVPFKATLDRKIDFDNEIILRTIDCKEDLRRILDLLGNMEFKLSGPDSVDYDYEILDKCRWADQACKACDLNQLLIKGNRDILTCYSGKAVGKVGSDLNEVKESLTRIKEETENRRGCHSCSIKDHCAKCIFLPSFLHESEYCELRKGSPNLAIAVELPSLIHQLRLHRRTETERAKSIRIFWMDNQTSKNSFIENGLLKIKLDGNHYFYQHGVLKYSPFLQLLSRSFL